MFDTLPDELKKVFLSFSNQQDLLNTTLVSKKLNELSQDFLNKTVKLLPESGYYYAVGPMIQTSQSSSILDKGFPYPKHRKSIPDREIISAIPKEGTIIIFRTKEEAEQYAKLTQHHRMGTEDSYAATIFKVQLKESVTAQITCQEIKSNSPLITKMTAQVEYTAVDVNQLNFISGRVYGYPDISISHQKTEENPKNCAVM